MVCEVTQAAGAVPTIAISTENSCCRTGDNETATGCPDVRATAYQHVMPRHVGVQAEQNSFCGDTRVAPAGSKNEMVTTFLTTRTVV
jgi:hypothetical protein